MSPLIAAGLIGGASSLLGGLLGNRNNEKMIDRQNAYNHPSEIRRRAEEAGFNPLLFVGPGVGNQAVAQQDMMGSAIANAGMFVADKMVEQAQWKVQAERMRAETERLRAEVQQMTLRPEVPGIFGLTTKAAGASAAPKEHGPMFGPEAPVVLWDAVAGSNVTIDPRLAKRLGLKTGDALLAEDREAVMGEIGGEVGTILGFFESFSKGRGLVSGQISPTVQTPSAAGSPWSRTTRYYYSPKPAPKPAYAPVRPARQPNQSANPYAPWVRP